MFLLIILFVFNFELNFIHTFFVVQIIVENVFKYYNSSTKEQYKHFKTKFR